MRKKITSWLSFLTVFCMLAAYCTTAQAALQAAGPLDLVSTLPTWYQDTAGRSLQLCLDTNGFCVLPPFDATFTGPIATTGTISDANFPNEIFYFLADSVPLAVNGGDTAILRLAFEAAYLGGVVPNGGITFLRINLKKMAGLPPNGTFTVTHPYGTFQFTTDGAGIALGGSGAAFRTEDLSAPPTFFTPASFPAATNTHMGPFLVSSGGLIVVPGAGTYIGNPAIPTTVTGSPTGNNFFRIDGLNIGGPGINTVQTSLFTLQGKLFTGQIPSPMTVDRVTYARDAATGQVDAFVTALPSAIPNLSGTGILTTNLAQDFPATGKFFAHLPFTTVLPSALVLRNSLDVPPIDYPITLVDEVNITQSFYDPVSRNLTIHAASRDKVAPLPVLTVPALAAPNTLDATGTLVKALPVNTIPPKDIAVSSSKGGSATATVSIFTPPAPPVAVADTATTPAGTAVTINVIANDTPPLNINPASVVISTQSLNGVAVANANGTVTFTPATGFVGPTTTFAYTVKDNLLQTSNAATVTVTVTAPPAPVAVADTAAATSGTAVVIPVLANDTAAGGVNTTSVAVVTQPLNGTAVANINGTVTFTPAIGFSGATSFTYTFKDNLLRTSNAATVTVTVSAAAIAAPVAVNDTATTPAATPVVISVLINDLAGAGIIDPASVVISTPSINGTAAAGPTGAVTFTPAAGFVGSTTFAYTVKNTLLQVSNAAIVTVSVTGVLPPGTNIAPVAANDVASTLVNTSRVINVIANDTDSDGTINPASVVIVTTPTFGTAVNNLDGTVTYTSATAGTDSFTYNVKDNLGAVSNNATVTVSVTSAITDAVNVLRAEFVSGTRQWTVEGTTTNVSPLSKTVTIYIGNTTIGNLNILGTVTTNAADGRWKFTLPGAAGNPSPAPTNTISAALPSGASRLAFPVAVK